MLEDIPNTQKASANMLHMLNLRVKDCSWPNSARSRASWSSWSVGAALIGSIFDSRSIVLVGVVQGMNLKKEGNREEREGKSEFLNTFLATFVSRTTVATSSGQCISKMELGKLIMLICGVWYFGRSSSFSMNNQIWRGYP